MSCALKTNEIVVKEKPNILFILADDLGYSDLSCMGSSYYETPNIDAIANSGMVFTNGYAGSQVCSPSRATLMTGQFAARHGITDWIGAPIGEEWRNKKRYSKMLPAAYKHNIDTNLVSLPKAFKNAGYSTFFAGKWHLGDVGYYPEDYGFDYNKGGYHRGSPAGGYFAPFNNPKLKDTEKGENLSIRLAKETVNFIKNTKDKPFLAYLSFYAVHGPIQTNKEKWNKYREKAQRSGIADKGFEDGYFLPMRKHQDNPVYAGLVETMDDAVGLVLKQLKDSGLDKNTIVIFTSDNGGVVSGDNYSTNCLPLKGGKGYQWEGGIRVPFLVHVPWMNHGGQKNKTPVSGSDFFPTLLELSGLPLLPEVHVDGKSIVPALKGEIMQKRPLYWHYPHYGNQGGRPVSIVREGNWKLIHYWEDGSNELYNLAIDIHEDNDLAVQQPMRTQEMYKNLMQWLQEVGAKYPSPDPLYNPQKEQLAIIKKKADMTKFHESLRKGMLDKNWEPNKTWWGSIPTID
ncbi:sulfatase [Algibacter amylolyticus]|uniref:Sulfatase n=2 Tax=Algibacter amylolyticus TaxID=1608400 RepID=A0A5M7B5P8_9FLAO|nr:sulfatase [Algibacter amylolyticus]TSJ76031.1 sulfatase [Algibacter amylolyticus]